MTADTPEANPPVLNNVSRSTQVGNARPLSEDWTPNHTHVMVAQEHGVDLDEVVEEFLTTTRAAQLEKRSNWDATFTAYLRDFGDHRERWARA